MGGGDLIPDLEPHSGPSSTMATPPTSTDRHGGAQSASQVAVANPVVSPSAFPTVHSDPNAHRDATLARHQPASDAGGESSSADLGLPQKEDPPGKPAESKPTVLALLLPLLAWLFVFALYVALGGAIFVHLEADYERLQADVLNNATEALLNSAKQQDATKPVGGGAAADGRRLFGAYTPFGHDSAAASRCEDHKARVAELEEQVARLSSIIARGCTACTGNFTGRATARQHGSVAASEKWPQGRHAMGLRRRMGGEAEAGTSADDGAAGAEDGPLNNLYDVRCA